MDPFDCGDDRFSHGARDRIARQLQHVVMSIPGRLVQQWDPPDECAIEPDADPLAVDRERALRMAP